ncbi:MAG: thiamine pyrophosphate-binding protein, partial [Candidatus Binatia bacterium]
SPAGEPAAPDVRAVRQAADILSQAKRPLLIVGKGLRWSEPYAELSRLVSEWGIPFIASPMGRGALPDDHPLCCSAVRGLAQSKADAVLLLGARLDWTFRFGSEIPADAKLIQVDIHPPEIGVNVAPAVGIVGDAGQFLRRLLDCLEPMRKGRRREGLASWHGFLGEAREGKERELAAQTNSERVPMSPYRMLKELRDSLPRNAVCILDGNVSMAAAQQVLPSYLPASRLTAGSNGCMGVGIPFAIGAKLHHPDRPVVAVCGDTAFGFNAMEMETAVRHGIAIVVVVVNNEGISGALTEKALFPWSRERVTMFQPGIHYENIMRAFGGHCEFVERPEQLKPALERALASAAPACINVRVDPDAPYPRD